MIAFQWLTIFVGVINILLFFYIQVDRIIRLEKKKEYLKKKRERLRKDR